MCFPWRRPAAAGSLVGLTGSFCHFHHGRHPAAPPPMAKRAKKHCLCSTLSDPRGATRRRTSTALVCRAWDSMRFGGLTGALDKVRTDPQARCVCPGQGGRWGPSGLTHPPSPWASCSVGTGVSFEPPEPTLRSAWGPRVTDTPREASQDMEHGLCADHWPLPSPASKPRA